MKNPVFEHTKLIDTFLPMNVFQIITKNPTIISPHWHEHFELLYLEQGEANFHIGGRAYPCNSGDIIFVNSGEVHAAYSNSPHTTVIIHPIVFHPSIISSASNETDYTVPYLSGKSLIETKINRKNQQFDILIKTFTSLIKEYKQKQEGYKMAIKAYCQLLFTFLARDYTLKREDNLRFQLKADRFKLLMKQIDHQFSERMKVKEAAAIVHMSPYHFCKTFKQFTGSTYVQYVNHRRVLEAEKLLTLTSLSITEISEKVGFANVNGFSKLFKQIKGYSPSHVRK